MFVIAGLIGVYSYGIFLIGILGFLTRAVIISYSLVLLATLSFYFRRTIFLNIHKLLNFLTNLKRWDKFYLSLIAILVSINLIGALGPETAFDSLWYHLTLPKIYLSEGQIFYIPGSLLYYSAMPKLIDMLFIPSLAIGIDTFTRLLSLFFGILSLLVLFKLSRIFFGRTVSLLVLVIFYSNLAVAWQSTTAYIDMGRTFYEVLALYFLILFFKGKEESNLIKSGALIGFSISAKLLALGSLISFLALLAIYRIRFLKIMKFTMIALFIPIPWFLFSYLNTANPFYPLLSNLYQVAPNINLAGFINFIRSADPISPIYLITLPLCGVYYRKFSKLLKTVVLYSILVFTIWFWTPQTGGGRFIMPYLPAFSILAGSTIFFSRGLFKQYLIGLILVLCLSTIIYRGVTNIRYVPVVFGFESRESFLSTNLNFEFGDFYDTDGFFKKNIKQEDKVLIYGVHNLYYVDFPFIHESYAKKADKFNYVLAQNTNLPHRFRDWSLIYDNNKTHVKLYTKEGLMWEY